MPRRKNPRRHYVSKNADVGIAMTSELIDRDEKEKGEKRASGQNHSGPAQPVAEITPKRPGLRGAGSIRHRCNCWRNCSRSHQNPHVDPGIRIDCKFADFSPAANSAEGSRYFFNERT